ncbi:chemotaxis protein CheC [Candidatus Gastranaerophilus sp. (ex Termes propinquus)]|nr:chemotaxis protein CheC [Candidatus Gastranaerophilus sp. (ex Termes propinquus)]
MPKDFVAVLSEILTGADAVSEGIETLTEVQINTYIGLFSSVAKNMQLLFRNLYDEGLDIVPDNKLILDTDEQYDKVFGTKLNLAITYSLSFNDKKKYSITLICDKDTFIKSLVRLGLHQEEYPEANIDVSQLGRVSDIKVKLYVELGGTKIPLKRVLEIDNGSVVELDSFANSDVDVYADNVKVANAQIVAVEDNYGVKITKIISRDKSK